MGKVVRIFYPADPAGVIPGGIDTFIRGILNWADPDLDFELVGVTTEPELRPVGQWTECQLGRGRFRFFPVLALLDAGQRSAIPLTLRYTWGVMKYRQVLAKDFDIMDFHRIEPVLPWLLDRRPKHLFQHQHMKVLHNSQADIRWKHAPFLFELMEKWIIPGFRNIWCVHNDAVEGYRERFPALGDRVRFCPTWMDPDIFSPPATAEARQELRAQLAGMYGISTADRWLIFVGRIDSQKNPDLLLRGFAAAAAPGTRLLIVGDGVLGAEARALAAELGVAERVHFLGILPQKIIANLLRASDLFVLSSAYEGMPMCVLEALGCGLPVVTTAVGEVRQVVLPGVNGEIASSHEVASYAQAISQALTRLDAYRGQPCLDAVERFTPAKVLEGVFARYRE
jgi:glycosyltransferase involved in cell wall biosynthesis